MRISSAIAAALLLAFQSAVAAPRQLNDAGLIDAYADKTHISFYRRYVEEYGGKYFVESYSADGTLRYRAGDVALSGFWQVANGRICFQYPDTPLYDGCFVVAYEAGCFYSYQVDENGEPFGLAAGEWWIRAHIEGTKPDCAAGDLLS